MDLFHVKKREQISLHLGIKSLWNDLIVLISTDSHGWSNVEFDPEKSKISDEILLPQIPFRFIQFMMTKDSNVPFNVCNLEVKD